VNNFDPPKIKSQLCRCGHSHEDHEDAIGCCSVAACQCRQMNPASNVVYAPTPDPEPERDTDEYVTLVLTKSQVPALNDCLYEGMANADIEDMARQKPER